MQGIDVSKWNGDIDFSKVKKSGVEFVIIRDGFGQDIEKQIDVKFMQNYKNAKENGLYVGVYHYCYAKTPELARGEARFCLKNINGMQLEFPIVIDIEDSSLTKLSRQEKTDIVKAFCSEIENAGYYAMYYCNLNWLNSHLYREQLSKYDLWLAQWNVTEPSVECGIWQMADNGKIDGISGNVDMNMSFKDYPKIMIEKGINGYSKNDEIKKEIPKQEQNPSNDISYINYIVIKGDTLSKIANKYNTTISELIRINNINNPNIIYENQFIKVPVKSSDNIIYTVQKGDTLSNIAIKYNTSVDIIVKLNSIADKNKIYVGQVLKIK